MKTPRQTSKICRGYLFAFCVSNFRANGQSRTPVPTIQFANILMRRSLLPSFSFCFTSLSRYAGWIRYHDRTNEIGKKPTHGRAENGKEDPEQADHRGINIQIFGNAAAHAIPLFVGLRFIKLFLHKDLPSRGSPHCHNRIILKRRDRLAPFVF